MVLAQSEENKEFVDRVYDYFAVGSARSLNSLNIMTREQADDPRVAEIVQGADLIWIGGGSQCSFLRSGAGRNCSKRLRTPPPIASPLAAPAPAQPSLVMRLILICRGTAPTVLYAALANRSTEPRYVSRCRSTSIFCVVGGCQLSAASISS